MPKALKFQFASAALLASVGCYALLAHWSDPASFFAGLPLVALAMSRSEMYRPVPSRELLVFLIVVWALVIVVVTSHWLLPNSVAADVQRALHHPAFVLPFWLLLLSGLYRIYGRQKAEVDA